jgi:hypothetical protein
VASGAHGVLRCQTHLGPVSVVALASASQFIFAKLHKGSLKCPLSPSRKREQMHKGKTIDRLSSGEVVVQGQQLRNKHGVMCITDYDANHAVQCTSGKQRIYDA